MAVVYEDGEAVTVVLDVLVMEGTCPDTANGWLWACDEHEEHGTALTSIEAERLADVHVEYRLENLADDDPEDQGCRAIVWRRDEKGRA